MAQKDTKLGRRDAIKAGAAATAAATAPQVAQAQDQSIPAPDQVQTVQGEAFSAIAESNPLDAKITTFTTVSPDVDASIAFYRDAIGMAVVSDEVLPEGLTTAPGIGGRRRQVLLNMPESEPRSGAVRILDAPANAAPIRPRPESGPNDPGLLVLEGLTRDPAESYRAVTKAGASAISPPRYYFFRNTMWAPAIDVMSYAPFGPGGEQMFLTANVGSQKPPWKAPGLHAGFISASVTSLDQRPVVAFFEKALGLKVTAQMECYQNNVNELIGAPEDSYFLWSFVGSGVALEVWEFKAESGTLYPCSLDKTGLAMLTLRVNDLEKCRAMCAAAGIEPVGDGALPNVENDTPEGFTLRGAVGELYEIVQA